jgi:hypothetical protein
MRTFCENLNRASTQLDVELDEVKGEIDRRRRASPVHRCCVPHM